MLELASGPPPRLDTSVSVLDAPTVGEGESPANAAERTALVPAPVFDDEPEAPSIGSSPPPSAFELESTTDAQAELPNFPVQAAEVEGPPPSSEDSAEITRRVPAEIVASVQAAFADLPKSPSPELLDSKDTLPPAPLGPLASGAADDLSATAIDAPLPRAVLAALEGRRVVERQAPPVSTFDPLDRADTPPIGKKAPPIATPPLRLPPIAAPQVGRPARPPPGRPNAAEAAVPASPPRPSPIAAGKAHDPTPAPIDLAERRRERAALLTPIEGSLALLFVAVVMFLLAVAPPAGSRSVSLVTRAAPEPPPPPPRPTRPPSDQPRPAPPAPLIAPGLSPAETQAALEKLASEVGPTPNYEGEGE